MDLRVGRMSERDYRPTRLQMVDQKVKLAFSWTRRGFASPPRKEPRIEVGVFTVVLIVPRPVPSTSFNGCPKLGWLNRLKNCAPTFRFADSQWGTLKPLVRSRSVSV